MDLFTADNESEPSAGVRSKRGEFGPSGNGTSCRLRIPPCAAGEMARRPRPPGGPTPNSQAVIIASATNAPRATIGFLIARSHPSSSSKRKRGEALIRAVCARAKAEKEDGMIARIWKGAVRAEDADAYLDYLQETGFKEYRETPGNRGLLALRRAEGDRCGYILVTLWDSIEAVEAFAGDDIDRAVFYPEDERFLVERDETSSHHDVVVCTFDV
jgi:heme-degrading monooxygenase HmoA